MKPKVVVLTGAGMSAESGIKTFRDSNGLWEGYDVMEVASINGWLKNQALVLDFYNQRRRQLFKTSPNKGHLGLADLQNDFDVHIITQNVDDLHERAGSKKVLHLHGELRKVKSTLYPELIYAWDKDLNVGDKCEKGAQLRPHIVWFGEMVPALEEAKYVVADADILVVIGTSMVVYPAASLIHYAKRKIPKFIIDPKIPEIEPGFFPIECGASEGVEKLIQFLETIKNKKEES